VRVGSFAGIHRQLLGRVEEIKGGREMRPERKALGADNFHAVAEATTHKDNGRRLPAIFSQRFRAGLGCAAPPFDPAGGRVEG
jgi:hypothetical protein